MLKGSDDRYTGSKFSIKRNFDKSTNTKKDSRNKLILGINFFVLEKSYKTMRNKKLPDMK